MLSEPSDVYTQLMPGDPAPWFTQKCGNTPRFSFSTMGGRYLLLGFILSAEDAAPLHILEQQKALFDDHHASFFGVSVDPKDAQRALPLSPGIRWFWDFDYEVSRLYGALPQGAQPGTHVAARRFWLLVDPTFRIMQRFAYAPDGSNIEDICAYIRNLPPPSHFAGPELMAPVLYLPNVFDRQTCAELIQLYQSGETFDSGFMREVNGKTVMAADPAHKRRFDHLIMDESLRARLRGRVLRTIVPELRKVFQFDATRMERYLIGCYRAEDGGHFRAHRDNTTRGTAHRRFAVSVNLNADFEGGELSFPEYGPRLFKPEPGAAVVFSCSLLHAVSTVTQGVRYAFLPFLYDEAAAKTREANNAFLGEGLTPYQS